MRREVALYIGSSIVAIAVGIAIGAGLGLVTANVVVMLGW